MSSTSASSVIVPSAIIGPSRACNSARAAASSGPFGRHASVIRQPIAGSACATSISRAAVAASRSPAYNNRQRLATSAAASALAAATPG
jgi:hypothetical protein